MKVTSDLEEITVTHAGTGETPHLVYAVVIDQGQLYTGPPFIDSLVTHFLVGQ
jgi:hypothetical protein